MLTTIGGKYPQFVSIRVIDIEEFFKLIELSVGDIDLVRELIDSTEFSYGSNGDTLMTPNFMKVILDGAGIKYAEFDLSDYMISFGC